MRQRKWKYTVVAMIVLFALVLGVRQTHFQSVDSYRQEQERLAQDVTENTGGKKDKASSPENELASMYVSPNPEDSAEKQGTHRTISKKGGNSVHRNSKDTVGGTGSSKTKDTVGGTSSSKTKDTVGGTSSSKTKDTVGGTGSSKTKDTGSKKPGQTAAKKPSQGQSRDDKKPDGTAAADAGDSDNNGSTAASTADSSASGGHGGTGSNADSQRPENADSSGNNAGTPTAGGNSTNGGSGSATQKPDENKITCTIEIRCDSLVENKKQAQESIWKYIPESGIMMDTVSVKVDKDSSVYDVLEKACKVKGIALDAVYTPLYKSYYVKGIGHIYEKQAGDMSGWIYKVNGKAPNRGASAFKVSENDVISWQYTCDGKTT